MELNYRVEIHATPDHRRQLLVRLSTSACPCIWNSSTSAQFSAFYFLCYFFDFWVDSTELATKTRAILCKVHGCKNWIKRNWRLVSNAVEYYETWLESPEELEITSAVQTMKNKKSPVEYGIPPDTSKYCFQLCWVHQLSSLVVPGIPKHFSYAGQALS